MADSVECTFEGLDQMLREVRELPRAIRNRVMKGMVATGASVIRKEAIRLAPVATGKVEDGHPPPGTLKRAIYQTRVVQLCTEESEVWRVGVRSGKAARTTKRGKGTANLDAYYASWVEYGHFTRGPKGAKRSAVARAAAVTLGDVHWVQPIPFMRPAVLKMAPAALEAMRDYLNENLADALVAMQYLHAVGKV